MRRGLLSGRDTFYECPVCKHRKQKLDTEKIDGKVEGKEEVLMQTRVKQGAEPGTYSVQANRGPKTRYKEIGTVKKVGKKWRNSLDDHNLWTQKKFAVAAVIGAHMLKDEIPPQKEAPAFAPGPAPDDTPFVERSDPTFDNDFIACPKNLLWEQVVEAQRLLDEVVPVCDEQGEEIAAWRALNNKMKIRGEAK